MHREVAEIGTWFLHVMRNDSASYFCTDVFALNALCMPRCAKSILTTAKKRISKF